MTFLTVNAGSSSLKLSVFDELADEPKFTASIEGIGLERSTLITDSSTPVAASNHLVAVEVLQKWLSETLSPEDVVRGVSHRVVHGGDRYKQATIVDQELLSYLESITLLAPNHLPVAIACLRAFASFYPRAAHVACFDTGYFHDVPAIASTTALPKRLRDRGVKRYGFHGLSYEYILSDFARHEGEAATKGRVIMAHLGSGASVTASLAGKPLDMTMGFTPASGIMMSTRSGDIDPGIIDVLLSEEGASKASIRRTLYEESGLLGVSELSADMQTLLQAESSNPKAALAVELFCYTIKKAIGSYSAVLGGVDSIIFSGGIGERAAEVRRRILEGLEYLGIIVDQGRNTAGERLVSANGSKVGVHIIATHEDRVLLDKMKSLIGEAL